MGVLPCGGAGRGEGYPINEETRLTLELEQAHKRLRRARENLRLARREHSLAVAEANMLAARLVREKYGNKPFKERLPRLSAGRTNDEEEKYRRKLHNRT